MAYATPGNFNFFPYLDTDMRVLFARNPRRMPLARYAMFADAKRQLTHYTVIDNTVGSRFPSRNKFQNSWPDGQKKPDGQINKLSARYESLSLDRHSHAAPHGAMALANQPYDVQANQMFLMGTRAGTLRALWAYEDVKAAITATTLPSAALGTAVSGATDITAGTVTSPTFLKALLYGAQQVHQNTAGTVNEMHLKVVMGPDVAIKLAASAEMLDYVSRSPDAMSVLQRGFSNNRFGLPLVYHGFELIVEDTTIITSLPGANAVTTANVFNEDNIWLLARFDKGGGSGAEGPDAGEGNIYPTTLSTLTLFEGPYYTLDQSGKQVYRDGTYGMGSEVWVDTRNEIVEAGIRDNFGTKLTAPVSGFAITDVLP